MNLETFKKNRMLPSIHNAFMREFFFNFQTNFNFEKSRLNLLNNR